MGLVVAMRKSFPLLMLFAPACLLSAAETALGVPFREADKYYLQKPKTPVAWDKTFVTFSEFRGSWSSTIQTFAKVAGMELITINPPPDHNVCGIYDKVDGSKFYSLKEAFDIINEKLLGATHHTLIRSGDILYLISADELYDALPRLDRLALRDLRGRGNTEIVEIVVRFDPDHQGQVKKWLGEFGLVIPQENGGFVLQGTVASLTLCARLFRWNEEP